MVSAGREAKHTEHTHKTHRTHTQSLGVLWIRSTNHRNRDQTRNSPTDLTFETTQHHRYLFYPEDLTRILFQKFSNLQEFGGIPFHALFQSLLVSVPVLMTQLVNVQRGNRASWNIDTHLEIWQLSPELLGKTWKQINSKHFLHSLKHWKTEKKTYSLSIWQIYPIIFNNAQASNAWNVQFLLLKKPLGL